MTFAPGVQQWRARLGSLRQVVRQELVTRQLGAHLPERPLRVLDVGCGQGTQAIRLAERGHAVTGVDSSEELLGVLERDDHTGTVRAITGDVLDVARLAEPGSFDVVLCHGVLMYFPDPGPLLGELARMVAPGGLLSLLVRNADGLALRPGLRGDWATVAGAFDGNAYRNRLGIDARADRRADLVAALEQRNLETIAWYGVRVFTDNLADDVPPPGPDELAALIDCEERAGATDPYRSVASFTHLIATIRS